MSQFIPKLLCVLFLGLPLVSHASELRLLIDMLHENDMISEQQYDRLLAELEQNQQHAAKEKQQIVEKLELATQPSEVEVSAKGGLRISSTDGEFETRIRGRLMIDAADYDARRKLLMVRIFVVPVLPGRDEFIGIGYLSWITIFPMAVN